MVVSNEHAFYNTNGIVKEINADRVKVSFAKEFASLFGYEDHDKRIKEFDKKELQKFNLDDHPHIKVKRLYGNRYHKLNTKTYKFSPENDCMYRGCKEKNQKRILYNTSGSVGEFDVCLKHAQIDGDYGKAFRMKDKYQHLINETCN